MDLGLAGKKVLITGASQGIGAGLVQSFAAAGCELYLVARSADKLAMVAGQARQAKDKAVHVLALDLTARSAVEQVMAFAGDAQVLVNNAGSIPGGTLWEVDEERWREGWELKVYGYINLTRAMYLAMKRRGSGVILNNIGSGGQNPDFNYIAGSTGCAALMAFTCALGGASLADGIRVVGVNPGPVDTPRVVKLMRGLAQKKMGDAERFGELLAQYPLGRVATVAEVSDLFVYLASERSSYTSGTIFTVDGGSTSRRSV